MKLFWSNQMLRITQVAISALLATSWLAPSAALAGPSIQSWQTSNGARVLFVPAPDLPMLDLRIVFDAGSARDGGKPGLAAMTNSMLRHGAGNLTTNAIAEHFEGLGASSGNGARRDMAWVSLRSLSDPKLLQPALDMTRRLLLEPSFPASAFERERRRLLVGLKQQKQRPGSIAEKAFFKALYGDHPYATPTSGTEESVKGFVLGELQAFHRRYYVASNAVIALVGALDRKAAEALVENLIGAMPAGERAPELPQVASLTSENLINIDHPSSQSHLLMGQPGVRRGDPDYFSLYVGNHILGGSGLISRLSDEIREKRGLSYSVYSYFLPMRMQGPFQMGLQTRNESVEEAIGLMNDQLNKFLDEGPKAEELEASKKNITGGFPLRVDSNKKIVGYLAMIGFYGLPLDYLDRFNEEVEKVTLESIQDAFRRRLKPEQMVKVVVGKQAAQ